MKHLQILTLIAILLLAGCQGAPKNKQNKKTIIKTVPVLVDQLSPKTLNQYISITAKLEGITDIQMNSEVSGKVISINKHLGDWVETGEKIGSIDNSDYRIKLEQAEAALLAAEATLTGAQMQLNASQSLFEKEIISQLEYSQSLSSFKNAQAGFKGAKAGVEQAQKAYNNSRFIAPVSGYITDTQLEIGQTVNMGSYICSLVNSKRLKIKTGIGEKNIQYVNKGQHVLISHNGGEWNETGIVTGMGIKPSANSANYPIEIELPNTGMKMYPGMVIEAKILSNVYEDVIFTSLNNILQQYDLRYVFVINSDNKAEKKIVTLGNVVGENVVINSGVNIGDKLVIEGAENIEEGSSVEIRKSFSKE